MIIRSLLCFINETPRTKQLVELPAIRLRARDSCCVIHRSLVEAERLYQPICPSQSGSYQRIPEPKMKAYKEIPGLLLDVLSGPVAILQVCSKIVDLPLNVCVDRVPSSLVSASRQHRRNSDEAVLTSANLCSAILRFLTSPVNLLSMSALFASASCAFLADADCELIAPFSLSSAAFRLSLSSSSARRRCALSQ